MAERSCRVCGCTENAACVDDVKGPCWWAETDLCSHCLPFVADAHAMTHAQLWDIAARLRYLEADREPAAAHPHARNTAISSLEHMRADLAGVPALVIVDRVLTAYLTDIALYAMVEDAVEEREGPQLEEEARQRLRRIEREIQWMMIPGHVGHEIHVAVVGQVEVFDKNPRMKYRNALGERLAGRACSIDEAQADVVAEVVRAVYTKRHQARDDAEDTAKANGWVVYSAQESGDAAKALTGAGIKWVSMTYLDPGVSIVLEGPVPEALPDGILREKPSKESP